MGLMFEIVTFEMEGGAGSKSTSGAIGPDGPLHQEGEHTSWYSVGILADRDRLPGQPPTLQWPPLSALFSPVEARSVRSVPGTLRGAKIHGVWSQQIAHVHTCISRRGTPMAEAVPSQTLGGTEEKAALRGREARATDQTRLGVGFPGGRATGLRQRGGKYPGEVSSLLLGFKATAGSAWGMQRREGTRAVPQASALLGRTQGSVIWGNKDGVFG